jgi:sterol desaturase/sphingolipid hydroxylase (fatty acid hydroxylase superfamily)
MIDRFIHSICIIINPFILSTISAIYIFNYYKYPFISPVYSISKIKDRIKDMNNSIPALLASSIAVNYIIYPYILPNNRHNELEICYSILSYCILIEFIYYVYHRLIHFYGYKTVHKKHHKNVNIYPFDTFFFTYIDDIALIYSLGIPVIFLRITYFEQFIVLYMYITCSYISHSKLFWKHHVIHHELLCYNYCILFPIFDILCNTYKQ